MIRLSVTKHSALLFGMLALAVLPGTATMAHADTIPAGWFDRTALPEGLPTLEAQRFLLERVPPLELPDTQAAWEEQAAALRRTLLQTVYLEGAPASWITSTPQVVWCDTIPHDAYTIRLLRYAAVPGLWIPAALYEPLSEIAPIPAVLNVNGHSYDQGKAEEVEQIRCATLARNGILALHPEWFACGELGGAAYRHGNLAYLDVAGVRGVSLFYLAMKRALDVLVDYPRIDPARVAMTGLSGGGWQTAVLSALDERISVIVPVAGHAGMKPRIEALYDLGDLEQVPSDFLATADYTHLTALFAPRPALLIYNQRDPCCFLPERALPTTYDAARPVYRLLGAEDKLAFYINEVPGTHNYEEDNRARLYRFLEDHFSLDRGTIREQPLSEEEYHDKEELYAGLPENNATFASLAQEVLATSTRPSVPEATEPAFPAWLQDYRALLADIVRPRQMTFTTAVRQSLSDGDVQAFRYTLKSDNWTVGALHLFPEHADTGRITLVIADDGIRNAKEVLEKTVEMGSQTLAFDPLFFGENMPYKQNPDALAMVFDATGERLLGLQAGQIMGVCTWAATVLHIDRIRLACVGWNASVAGLIACAALNREDTAVTELTLREIPESLGALITQDVKYDDKPALFCYAFLKHFDIPQLLAGCPELTVVRLP